MKINYVSGLVLGMLVSVAAVSAHGEPIFLKVINGKIWAGHYHEDGEFEYHPTYEEAEFDSLYFTDIPGFEIKNGDFPALSNVGFDVAGPVKFWDGTKWINTTPNDEYILIQKSINSVEVHDNTCPTDGFKIGVTNAAGAMTHTHVNYTLLDGTTDLPDGAAGVYVLKIRAWVDADGVSDSYPFFIFFNNGLTEEEYHHAIDHLNLRTVHCQP